MSEIVATPFAVKAEKTPGPSFDLIVDVPKGCISPEIVTPAIFFATAL